MEKTADSIIRARPLLGTFVEIAARGTDSRQLERAVDAAFAVIERIHGLMKTPRIADLRNIYEPRDMRELGFAYVGVGR